MKKAQITLFVILGIVILISGAFIFYFKGEVSFKPEFVEPRFQPIQNYVDSCIDDVSKEALTTIGLNGGYLKFPTTVEHNPNSYLSIGPIKDLRNPYWWYDGVSAIPTEAFIRSQLEEYIIEGVGICVANFSSFEPNFEIVQGDIDTIVELTDNNVDIRVIFPLIITDRVDGTQVKISRFIEVVPVRLKLVYELAREIMLKENEDMFLEKKTIDLIALDPYIPYTNVEISCEKKRWNIAELKNKLQRLLEVNLPYIKIIGTSFGDTYVPTPEGGTRLSDSYYDHHYKWDVSERTFDGMHVSFGYDKTYPMRFYVRPNKGSYIESNSQKGQDMMSFFCLHIWHFTYDVIYPVKVTIYDEETAANDEYNFIFAFKVSVDHNQPLRENFATIIFEGRDSGDNEEYCREGSNVIHVTAWDNVTDEPISDVNLTFKCGIYSCGMGATEWINFGAAAGVSMNLPYCVYGIIEGRAEDYEDSRIVVHTGKDGVYEMYMIPIKNIYDFEVVKHKYTDGSVGQEEPLGPDQKVSIMITQVNSSFSSYAMYPSEGFPIKLLAEQDFKYKLAVYLIEGEDMVGGYVAPWDVSWWGLEGADMMKIHVLEQSPKPSDENERYLFISGLNSYSQKAQEPEFLIR